MEKKQTTMGNFYSPYLNYGKDMNAWFKAYENDAEKLMIVGEKFFSKIIYRCEFYRLGENVLLVAFEPQDDIRIGDILVDEYGREFTIKSFGMFRYAKGELPEWAIKVPTVAIIGQDYSIGNYIAKSYGREGVQI